MAPPTGSASASATLTIVPVDAGIIRCICGYKHDDGYTIQCERCNVWQHVVCMGIRRDSVPDNYYCERCAPRAVKVESAREIQRRHSVKLSKRKKSTSGASTSASSTANGKTGASSTFGGKQSTVSAGSSIRSISPDAQATATSTGVAHGASSNASAALHRKSGASTDHHAPTTSAPPHTSTGNPTSDIETDDEDVLDPNDDYIPVGKCTVRGYDAVQLVKSMRETYFRQVAATSGGASNAAAAGTVDQDSLAYKLHAVSSRDSLVPANAIHLSVKPVVETRSSIQTGLFAVSAVRPGQLLIECKGELVRKSDYLATLDQQQRDAATGYAQQTSLPPGIAERFVHFHPALDLAVDARRIGNEARFVRYSCRPNARARSTIVTGATDASDIIHLCLYAEKAIGAGEEVTLAYDVEMGAAEYGKLALDCACADYYACGFNVNRKPLAKEKVEREMKMTVVVEVPAVERRSSVSPTAMDVDQAHGATKPPRARSPSAARPPSRVQTTQQPRQDTVTTDDVVLSDTDAADSGEERIPDTPTYDQQQLLSPTSGFLSREERKIRDELARFARMEKQREEKAKARRASSNKVAAGAGGGDGNESSASEKMTSKGGGKRGRGADRGSAASSRQSSAPSSPVSKAPLFLKRMWVQRYAAEQRNQLASVSERAGTAAGTGSSTPSISDTVSLLGSATVSNESLAVSPVRSEMQVERPPSTTIIVTAASVEDSRPVSPIQVDVTASSSVAPSAGHSPVHTNPAKRSAPPDEREEIEAAAASSMTVDTIDSTSATTTAVEPGASPTTVATTRISFKDYKKKRKIMQEQEQTPVSGDAGASAAPSAAVSPVRSEVPPTHGDNSQPVKSTDAPPSDLPTPPDATTKTDSTFLLSPRRPSPTRAASASRSPRRASSRSVSPRPPSSTH